MNELDEAWALALAEAERRARERGRGDVADYLALRMANDQLRAVGVDWLLTAFTTLIGEINRAGAAIQSARTEPHRFAVGRSTMVGTLLVFRYGVRALTIEAGWPRTPRDGIVRGGGLACARISHFGDRKAGDELLLVPQAEGAPQWLTLGPDGTRAPFTRERFRYHLSRFLQQT
jgi:hypothetical protein